MPKLTRKQRKMKAERRTPLAARATTAPIISPPKRMAAAIPSPAAAASTLAGQLQLGTVTVLDPNSKELLGYAFTEPHGAGQLQRWILYRHPQNSMMIASPPANMAEWSLDDWKTAVPQLWRPGSYYVRAQADLYGFGRTYGDRRWDELPPSFLLPKPTYPADDEEFQLDPHGRLIWWLNGGQRLGQVFVHGKLDGEASVEYWLLLPGYAPAGGAASMVVAESTEMAPDVDAFLRVATPSWAAGAVLAITGCRNFHDVGGQGNLPRIL
jgi:hypothetical protein